jgi:hypothetical protein
MALRFSVSTDSATRSGTTAFRLERRHRGFDAFHVIQTSDRDGIFVIVATDAQALDRIAIEVGSPWMRANVVFRLAAPPTTGLAQSAFAHEVFHPQFVNHHRPEGISIPETDRPASGLQAFYGALLQGFPDATMEIDEQLAERDDGR